MKKIDVLIGDNLYDTASYFSKGLAGALERLGVKTRLHWIGEGHFFHALYDILEDPPDMTCSFSDITSEEHSLGQLWNIPHLTFLIDPPIYSLHQLCAKKGWVSCVDEKDCAFVRALNFPNVFFFPHAAHAELKTPIETERPYEAVFFGTCIDYEAIASAWPKEERELLLEASEKVLSNEGCSVAEALIELGVQAFDLPRLHSEVDRYTRGKDRVELIRSVKDVPVHIWGEGLWHKYFPNQPIHASLTFEETFAVMRKSQVVLNSSPRFKMGTHERIFYALMCGAAVCTGENGYLRAELPSLFTYQYGQWSLPGFKNWKERAAEGQKKVLESHTWDCRALTLLANCKICTEDIM